MPDLSAIRKAVPGFTHVTVRSRAIAAFASRIEKRHLRLPDWRGPTFPAEDTGATAGLIVVANAINFSFWGAPKWTVRYRDGEFDGSLGLFAAITRAVESGTPVLDGSFLASLSADDLQTILRGNVEIPMFEARLNILRETGRVLVEHYGGSPLNLLRAAQNDAPGLVRLLTSHFPSFDDTARFGGSLFAFHKRAQLVAAMLYARFGGRGWGEFRRIDRLTLLADYKLPQILRELGILHYSPALAERIDRQEEIPAGSPEEVQIRAATVWAGACIRRALQPRFPEVTAIHLDGFLWTAGQDRSRPMRPYHRTRSIFY